VSGPLKQTNSLDNNLWNSLMQRSLSHYKKCLIACKPLRIFRNKMNGRTVKKKVKARKESAAK
jgi:hypothetical protein